MSTENHPTIAEETSALLDFMDATAQNTITMVAVNRWIDLNHIPDYNPNIRSAYGLIVAASLESINQSLRRIGGLVIETNPETADGYDRVLADTCIKLRTQDNLWVFKTREIPAQPVGIPVFDLSKRVQIQT